MDAQVGQYAKLGKVEVEVGPPPSGRIVGKSVTDAITTNPIIDYSVIQAENLDVAVSIWLRLAPDS